MRMMCRYCGSQGRHAKACRRAPKPVVKSLVSRLADDQYEPTAEEVEAIVAEQMACLPDWWEDVQRRRSSNSDPITTGDDE